MGRSDVALSVRQASLHVWKVVVHNTAKTLREILPSLFTLLLGCLAGTSYDKRQVTIMYVCVAIKPTSYAYDRDAEWSRAASLVRSHVGR